MTDNATTIMGRVGVRSHARSRRLRLIEQMTSSECAPACLAMVLGRYGHDVSSVELRRRFRATGRGVDAREILDVARSYGLRGRAYQVELEDLAKLGEGAVLHWNFDHWVVLGARRRGGFEIYDPAAGLRVMTLAELDPSLTGVALAFEPSEEFVERSGDAASPIARYWGLVRAHRAALGNAIGVSLFLQCLGFAPAIALAAAVEDLIPRNDGGGLLATTFALVVVALARATSMLVRTRILMGVSVRIDASLRSAFVEHLVALPHAFVAARSTGDLHARVNSTRALRDAASSTTIAAILDAAVATTFLVALVVLDPAIAAAAVLLAGADVVLVAATSRRRQRLMTERLLAEAECQGKQVELIAGLETLKAVGREDVLVGRWQDRLVDQLNGELRLGLFDGALSATREALALGVPAILIGIAGLHVARGQLSIGDLFALSAIVPAFITPVLSMAATVESLVVLQSVARRINEVFDEPAEVEAGVGARHELVGEIRFEAVHFSYDGETEALAGIDFVAAPGQLVGVVGPSGCGKSTLAKCIVGLVRPTAGCVRIDGVRLAELDLRAFRRQVGFVGQRPRLFGGSIRTNISLGADGECDVSSAARIACVHDEIEAFPMGYDTPVGEAGSTLSGGQCQRVALARAVASRPRLLVLDEATSALDSRLERMLHRNLEELGCSKVVIAHRLSTIRAADVILVMDAGKIVERGRHDELLAANGLYRQLWDAQHLSEGSTTEAGR